MWFLASQQLEHFHIDNKTFLVGKIWSKVDQKVLKNFAMEK